MNRKLYFRNKIGNTINEIATCKTFTIYMHLDITCLNIFNQLNNSSSFGSFHTEPCTKS